MKFSCGQKLVSGDKCRCLTFREYLSNLWWSTPWKEKETRKVMDRWSPECVDRNPIRNSFQIQKQLEKELN